MPSIHNVHALKVATAALHARPTKSILKLAGNKGNSTMLGLLTPPDSPLSRPNTSSKRQLTTDTKQKNADEPGDSEAGGREGISQPVSWKRFKELVDAGNLEPLGRSYSLQDKYEEYRAETMLKYGSMANYLTTHVLADFVAETKVPEFDPQAPLTSTDFMFRANDFPYYFSDNVEHWVLWCKKQLHPGFGAPEAAIRAIVDRFGSDVEWRYFVNPVKKQSVPQLSHAHVFVKYP
ncbi:hypothetical protein IW140_006588 [Coemansia sp. RSA 1813]|nr:hypothetical protein LPJ74_001791 [Coemansia sp. RSA 1843]KAJ2090597.1 hypothetical protein IW138_002605 [Coemansia sp. RSA 986]KAJ2210040.1 hypothetical protein EV179_006460 [Coemansia sp. RSA 487]KAJ2561329.1 hypothetical protein IW140_006588 [Coemansia sp. RSA 1813]